MTKFLYKQLNYLWRLFATGLGFVIFGVGGLIITVLMFIFIYLVPCRESIKCKVVRQVISVVFRGYIWFLHRCGLFTYEVEGRDRLKEENQLVIANHPSLLDVVFLISLIKQANCIVKEELWRFPMTRGPVTAAQYISNHSKELIRECVSSLGMGDTLLIFPEGTRSVPGVAPKFHRGAANIALMAKKNIIPVVIECTPVTLLKGRSWYHIPATPPHFRVRVLPEVNLQQYLASDAMQSSKARQLNAELESLFKHELRLE